MKKIFFIITSLSFFIASLSVAYYFIVFLPHRENMQKTYNAEIRKIQEENSDIRGRLESIQDSVDSSNTNAEDLQNSIQNTLNKEMENQANCERFGGRYQGDGLCAYY